MIVLTKSLIHNLNMSRTISTINYALPKTSVTYFRNLVKGDHINFNNDHSIVTDINRNTNKITVIKCNDTNIQEEIIKFPKYQTTFIVKYKNKYMDDIMPCFRRIPKSDSLKVAQYLFKKNDAFNTDVMRTSENFAYCCTIGYPINFKQLNLLMLAFGALKSFDKNAHDDIMTYMKTKKCIYYDSDGNIKVMQPQNIHI